MKEHQAVHASGRRLRRGLAALGVMVTGAWTGVTPLAFAAVPPDLSDSSLECVDSGGGALRSGDDISCTLTAKLEPDTENATITAAVTLPAGVDFASAPPPAIYDAGTRAITFDAQTLGFTFSSQFRTIVFHVTAAPGLDAGTSITLSGDITAVGELDGAIAEQSVNSPALLISPLVATLVESTVGCVDDNGGTLLPGETVTCTLDVVNPLGHEDASDVGASLAAGGASWLSGGSSTASGSTSFGTTDIGAVATGTDKSVAATFVVPTTALGGDLVTSSAFIAGLSVPSSEPIFLSKAGTTLVVSPGPANITLSSLGCFDTNSGLLLAGDDVTCGVTVKPLAGHEGVQGSTATVGIPPGAEYVGGADSHTATSMLLDTPSLGDVVAGQERTATFHIRIADLTPAGAVLPMAGTLNATSIPLGGPIAHPLVGPTLIVGKEVLQPGQAPSVTEPVTPQTVKPPAVAAKSYKLKAKTIRLVMRRGHRRRNHVWKGSKRRFVFVKKYVVRTPKISGKVVRKVTVPKKGKWAPERGKVKIKGTQLRYTLKKGVNPGKVRDRFRYTVTDTNGKKVTGTVLVTHKKN